MSNRRRKVVTEPLDPSSRDSHINYTFDEEIDIPISTRPRIEKSSIVTRSQTLYRNQRVTQTQANMEDNQRDNIPGSQHQAIANPSGVSASALGELSTQLERILTINHNMFMN